MPSPLEGWGLAKLLRRLPEDSCVVVYEPDPELWELCLNDLTAACGEDRRVHSLLRDSEETIRTLFHKLPLFRLRRCEFLSLNGAWLKSAGRTREVFSRLEEGIVQWWANRATIMKLGSLWIRNLFDNSCRSVLRMTPWPHWGHSITVVCGAGVTLESSLDWIKQHRAGLRVLAADTALGTLKSAGILPDAVVAVEAQWANLTDFLGTSSTGMALFADLTSLPAIPRAWATAPHWFLSEFAPVALLSRIPADIPRFEPLGSVGLYAVEIAWRLTDGPVILTGLDFSFPWGKSHARGAPSHVQILTQATRFRPVQQTGTWPEAHQPSLPGGWRTTRVLERYAKLLNSRIADRQDRTFSWGPSKVLTNLPPWSGVGPQLPLSPSSAALPIFVDTSWIDDERSAWRKLLALFDRLNTHPSSVSWELELEPLLRSLDYLWFDFPDPEIRADSDWLARAKVRTLMALDRWS